MKVSAEDFFTADIPGRPIVSNNNTPTENLSIFLNHYLAGIPTLLPSFIQDTPHFLRIIESLNDTAVIPADSTLVTLDVAALCRNIPINEGIDTLSNALTQIPQPHEHDVYLSLLQLVLSSTILSSFPLIISKYLEQVWAPISHGPMQTFSWDFWSLNFLIEKPLVYLRYIDDIFIIWEHGSDSLNAFISHLNSFHPSTKFTCHYSREEVNFLDTTVRLENTQLKTIRSTEAYRQAAVLRFHHAPSETL